MKLKELLSGVPVLASTADPELDIAHICYDSRKVTPGSLFVAVSGFAADGNRFIPMALEKGAAAVVTAKVPEEEIPYVLDPRRPGDIPACYADCTKAYEELGWKAEKTLDDMCADSLRWQRMNPNGFED